MTISAVPVRRTGDGKFPAAAIPDGAAELQEMSQMFTIEEESGTFSGTVHQHNGYYAGDFSRTPMRTARELSTLANLRPPTFTPGPGRT
jgi:hypothetical protein